MSEPPMRGSPESTGSTAAVATCKSFALQYADERYSNHRWATQEEAVRALRRRREVGSAVVWLSAGGVPKLWVAHWTETGTVSS
jgi:hypothetical protein